MLYFQHTEGRVGVIIFFIALWVAYTTYFTRLMFTNPIPCAGFALSLVALMRYIAVGPKARYLPENASSTEVFKKRKLADRPYAGKVAVVTGANRNIGWETTRSLSQLGAHVIMIDMEEKKLGEAAMDKIRKEDPEASLVNIRFNLSELDNIKDLALQILQAAAKLKKGNAAAPSSIQKNNSNSAAPQNQQVIDFLVNNAGMAIPPGRRRAFTREGYDLVYQVNHLGPYLLTEYLLPYMNRKSDTKSRIVNTASCAHTWWKLYPFSAEMQNSVRRCLEILNDANMEPYPTLTGYNLSKFSNLVHASHLARKLGENEKENSNVVVASYHPGAVWTDIWRFIPYPLKYVTDAFMSLGFKSSRDGHQTALHLLTAPHVISGQFYADCQPFRPRRCARDEKVWDVVDTFTRKCLEKWL